MGYLTVTATICFLPLTAKGFFPCLPLDERILVSPRNRLQDDASSYFRFKFLEKNPWFLSMSSSPSIPDGEYESGTDKSHDQPSSFGAQNPTMGGSELRSHPDEMLPLPPQPVSSTRKNRIEREKEMSSRFLHGDALLELREHIHELELDLSIVREKGVESHNIQQALYEAKGMDAEHVYVRCTRDAAEAEKLGDVYEAEKLLKEAMEAKSVLPQFNLEGLWVGKYGDHGYEMINVTYVDDMLIATKVTGDKNVPKGEVTFKCDVFPEAQKQDELSPIELSDTASKQWGQKYLPRFSGKGQVAAEGFLDNQFIEGQLILVGEYFSFAWVPIGHQIFFGRPSAELTLRMLKESKMIEFGALDRGPNHFAEMRAVAQRCFEETEMLMDDEVDIEGELCFLSQDEKYFSQEGCFE